MDSTLNGLLDAAWTTTRAHFAPAVVFAVPVKTGGISLTGSACALDCAHCGRHYLKAMGSLATAEQQAVAGEYSSFLVSGGCDAAGRVPFAPHRDRLRSLRAAGVRLNFHTGLVDAAAADALAGLADVVSFDFVVEEATIREVFGLPYRAGDYIAAYRELRRVARVVPHITVGVRGGVISGEYASLERLAELGADAVTFNVLRPTPGTRYAQCQPPAPSEVAAVLARARQLLPTTPLYLGCMRPGGAHRAMLDELALRAGVQRIVQPHRSTAQIAARLGLTIERREECCSL